MFTPQQIDQISFRTSRMQAGYNIDDVDAFLEPLTEDYVTLYKENALLKSKMRVLVGKLEEYRKNEAAMKEAAANAQRAADKMIREAEEKCAKMMANASETAAASAASAAAATETSKNNEAAIAAENARVEEARQAAAAKINELQEQLRSCIQALDRIKNANAPAAPVKAAFDFESDDMASEISKNLENLVGTTEDVAPKAEPKHPINDSTTSKFSAMNLQFGRNFDLKK